MAKWTVKLPKSTSQTALATNPMPSDEAAAEVIVAANAIRIGGKNIASVINSNLDAVLKPDGPMGYLVTPIYSALRTEYERTGELGEVILAMDGALRYRLLAEVLFSARSAGFRVFQLAVHRTDGSAGCIVLRFPAVGPKQPSTDVKLGLAKPPRPALGLSVSLQSGGIAVKSRMGRECPRPARQRVPAFEPGRRPG